MSRTVADREALLDRVLDLQHDLGKYLRLPLRMLPKDAGEGAVRAALHEALLETRRGAETVRSARALWDDFHAASADELSKSNALTPLIAAVERALTWEAALTDTSRTISRVAADEDFAAVQVAIDVLRDELEEHG